MIIFICTNMAFLYQSPASVFNLEEYSILQQQKKVMFYSPTKEFVRFSTYRTAQIKALKERIQKEKVTPQEITATQMRLQKLKSQYELLHTENHGELKEVLQNSEGAIAELLREKQAKEKEISEKIRQIAELESIKKQLQEKGALVEEQLRGEIMERQHVNEVKIKNDENILLLDKEFDSVSRETSKQVGIQEDVRSAEADLTRKWNNHRVQLEDCRKEKEELVRKIFEEKEQIAKQQKEWEVCQKQVELHQALKGKSKVTEQLVRFKLDVLAAEKARQTDTEWMLAQQRETEGGLAELASRICEETLKIEREELSCQKQIKCVLIKLSEQEETKYKLQQKIAVTKANLKLLKEKNENLKNKMNNIFKNDSQLIKTISNKKVYPNCKPEVIEIVKKSAIQPFASKENISLVLGKTEKIDSVASPRAFNEVSNRLA